MPDTQKPMQSKKFVAFLLSTVGWNALMLSIIWKFEEKIDHIALTLLVTMVITNGFIQIGYILGQAALDKYKQVALSATDNLTGSKDKSSQTEK
jgi:hypothetical protein